MTGVGTVDRSSLGYQAGNELIGPMLVTGVSLGAGGFAGAGRVAAEGTTFESVSVFWSGVQNRTAAEAFAQVEGRLTLNVTQAGRKLLERGASLSEWQSLSDTASRTASGQVHAFVRGAEASSVWNRTELVNLIWNYKVTNIIFH